MGAGGEGGTGGCRVAACEEKIRPRVVNCSALFLYTFENGVWLNCGGDVRPNALGAEKPRLREDVSFALRTSDEIFDPG